MGWVAATTFRLFLVLLLPSDSSFCVGSTDTFRGFPSVTSDEAIATPGKKENAFIFAVHVNIQKTVFALITWCSRRSEGMSTSWHPHHQGQHRGSVASTRLQSDGAGSQLLPSLPVMTGLRGVGDPLQLDQDLTEGSAGHLLHLHIQSLSSPISLMKMFVILCLTSYHAISTENCYVNRIVD